MKISIGDNIIENIFVKKKLIHKYIMRYRELVETKTPRIENGTTPLYHGTHAIFDGVPNIPNHSGIYGRGVYFSKRLKIAQAHGPIVVECTVKGKLASEKELDAAIAQAYDEGFRTGGDRYKRATDILIGAGYVGLEDYDIVVVYVKDAMTRI